MNAWQTEIRLVHRQLALLDSTHWQVTCFARSALLDTFAQLTITRHFLVLLELQQMVKLGKLFALYAQLVKTAQSQEQQRHAPQGRLQLQEVVHAKHALQVTT